MTRLRHAKAINDAKKILVGSYGERPMSELKPGQVHCPSCDRAVSITPTGRLRAHRDPDGVDCPQRLIGGIPVRLDEIPPVVLPKARGGNRTTAKKTPKGKPRFATGRCHTCDRAVTGERQFCGQCLRKRSRL